MCLGIPGEIVSLDDGENARATVNMAGVERPVDTSLLGEVQVGDWVVVHVGFALAKIDPDEARALLTMLDVDPATGRAVS
jgi:hydrogenase expression/formation protein HypC